MQFQPAACSLYTYTFDKQIHIKLMMSITNVTR